MLACGTARLGIRPFIASSPFGVSFGMVCGPNPANALALEPPSFQIPEKSRALEFVCPKDAMENKRAINNAEKMKWFRIFFLNLLVSGSTLLYGVRQPYSL